MFEHYKSRMAHMGANTSEILRMQSNMVIEQTWDRDPNYRGVYVVQVDSGIPRIDPSHELIDAKFKLKTYQTIDTSEVAYMLQFRHGEEKCHPEIKIGSYVYIKDEDGEWKWWLICHLDERPEFRQYQILECNWTFGWVVDGKIYHTLGVQRASQGSNSGSRDGKSISSVDNVTSAWLPTNSDTLTIGYNQRFLISDKRRYPPLTWQISKIEDTSPEGITKFKFTQETFNPQTDSYEFMLANYYSSAIHPETNDVESELSSNAVITYNGTSPTVKVGGNYKTFTAVFSNADESVKQWLISDENGDISTDTKNYTIEYMGSQMKLKIAQTYSLIGKTLIVQVMGTDGSEAELKMEVV